MPSISRPCLLGPLWRLPEPCGFTVRCSFLGSNSGGYKFRSITPGLPGDVTSSWMDSSAWMPTENKDRN
uniref:Uncharacterized protein n=1 Tax=Mus musculus TaxID=10090 RepID=Q3TMH8_MOUSE|nr:unnamed protein product [Mus musculus]BAE38464.1 unnamed protein product [Mus musculus]BAE41465.1 unnamed protein product [Mus musculus]